MDSSLGGENALEALSQMPFLTAGELAEVAGMPDRTARDVLRRLHKHRCIDAVTHTRFDATRVRRHCLGPAGIEDLSALRMDGNRSVDIVREQDLTSREGRQYLVARLDVVESLYRIALDAVGLIADRYEMKFTWRWERLGPLYAVMQFQDGRTVAMSRLGSTHNGEAISDRFDRLRIMHNRGSLQATLLLVPGPVELVRALNYFRTWGVRGVFVATEPDLSAYPLGSAIWHTAERDTLSLEEVLSETPRSDMPNTRRPDDGRNMPSDTIAEDVREQDLAVCELTIPARRIMRALFDYPFIRADKLKEILGFSEGHMGRECALLSRLGFIHRLRTGRTAKQRRRNGVRVVLSNAGRGHLRETDRSGPSEMASWHVVPHESGDEERHIPDFMVTGGNARTLAGQRAHTDGVYAFLALLAASCRDSRTRSLVQALPAHRWEREFKYARHRKPGRIKPDATIVLDHPDGYCSFVLEFERSARSDSSRARKLLPYQRYYASAATLQDFSEGRPTCLFVFERREYASAFVKFAGERQPALPMLVSSLDDLERAGSVFSASWSFPWNIDAGKLSLMSLSRASRG